MGMGSECRPGKEEVEKRDLLAEERRLRKSTSRSWWRF